MKNARRCEYVAGLMAVSLALTGTALAADGKGCVLQGTWYGVNNLDKLLPSGWVVTATGQSASLGISVREFPTLDTTFNVAFAAVDASVDRGVWKRGGSNTSATHSVPPRSTLTGIAFTRRVSAATSW